MNRDKRTEIFSRLRAINPKPTTELDYRSPFELLISVILSAQATDKSVNLATRGLFAAANTPAAMVELGVNGVTGYIKSIGLFNSKARNVVGACRILIDEHGGEVPEDRASLEKLPGVGRKTANVVLNTAFGHDTIAVDTHIFRVSNRTRIARGRNPREVEDRLVRLVPEGFRHDAHHWLILHGRYVCKARKPDCMNCAIADLCEYPDKLVLEPPRLMFGQDRRELRETVQTAWTKARAGQPLSPLEALVAGVLDRHPEYHACQLENPASLDRDYLPTDGETNPFLHIALHVAVREQLSIDRPPGLVAAFDALCAHLGESHEAEHAIIECLAEALWTAQRDGSPPDEAAYLAGVRARAGAPPRR